VPAGGRNRPGVRLVTHELGDQARPPLLFLHALGIGTSGRYVAEIAPLLRRRVIGVDAPGFGDTPAVDPDGYALSAYLPRLVEVLDALGLERTAVMGHSWGGLLACHLAAAVPERLSALALLDSGPLDYADQPGVDPDLPLEAWIERAGGARWQWPSRDAFLAELREDATRTTPAYEQAVLAGMVEADGSLRGPSPEVRGAVYRVLAGTRASEAWPAIDAAGIPTLLVYATEPPDRRAENEKGAERLCAAIRAAEAVPLPGAGHDLIADAGPALASIVADWLDERHPLEA
jgi:pimeloyl-ACP methyl ester carboxylesterase